MRDRAKEIKAETGRAQDAKANEESITKLADDTTPSTEERVFA